MSSKKVDTKKTVKGEEVAVAIIKTENNNQSAEIV
jgi:hypothetical protein